MNRRRTFLTALGATALIVPLRSFSQSPAKMARIGVTAAGSAPSAAVDALRKRLAELGWIEGRNLQMDVRYAGDDPSRYAGFMADFVKQNVDLIVAGGGFVRAAMEATSTIPIVVPLMLDPVANKIVASLARPGGNVTGMSVVDIELNAKRIEMLRELLPAAKRLAVLMSSTTASSATHLNASIEVAAKSKGFELHTVTASRAAELPAAFDAIATFKAQALLILPSSLFNSERKQVVQLAATARLPVIYEHAAFTSAGGLISYGADFLDMYRQSAVYVDKILRGAKPAHLPVQQPTHFDLVVNLGTAKALGLQVPQPILLRANRVIE